MLMFPVGFTEAFIEPFVRYCGNNLSGCMNERTQWTDSPKR